jgi:outer membrane immunogenic protein
MSRLNLAAAVSAALILSAPMASASPFEFAGFYAGAHAGYSASEADLSGGDLKDNGLMGGIQAGYNFIDGNFMYGLETDISLTGADPDNPCPGNPGLGCELESGPMATLRARAGYAVDNWMIYATGGMAASRFELDTDTTNGDNEGMFGWTVGAGAEYLLGDIVGLKLEYRYLQFGDFDDGPEDLTGANIDVDTHVIMGGINFHF